MLTVSTAHGAVRRGRSPDQDTADANAGDELAAMTQVTGLNGTPLDKPAPLVRDAGLAYAAPSCTDVWIVAGGVRPCTCASTRRRDGKVVGCVILCVRERESLPGALAHS